MRFEAQAVLHGLNSSKGEFEGRPYDSTTFHLAVELPERATGEKMGNVTRPFKLGTSEELQKWKGYKDKWPANGVNVSCIFEMVAGVGNESKMILVDVRPAAKG